MTWKRLTLLLLWSTAVISLAELTQASRISGSVVSSTPETHRCKRAKRASRSWGQVDCSVLQWRAQGMWVKHTHLSHWTCAALLTILGHSHYGMSLNNTAFAKCDPFMKENGGVRKQQGHFSVLQGLLSSSWNVLSKWWLTGVNH